MSVPSRYILHQVPVIAGLLESAVDMATQNLDKSSGGTMQTPGPLFERTVAPLPSDLINDYVAHVGGESSWYKKTVPAHLFPQWCFPLSTKTLKGVPYPLAKVMNGGCRLEMNAPLPRGEALVANAQLTSIDDNGSRAVLTQKLTSGPKSNPEAIVGYFYPVVPLGKKSGGGSKQKPTVPEGTREICRWKIPANAGLEFAKLTGDFNPIHWIGGYAKSFGFNGVILHGFSTMARSIEAINRNILLGDIDRLKVVDCRFTRPLHIPADVGLFVDGEGAFYVGTAPGGPAYLVGSYELR